ncbi:arginine--tRNA ligase [Apilactobacillus micheneri]|uniref:Arginine--tRNA ligase n=1 Tax=Apilactobacillus micheneri TaxID=1899430 RepID=A0A2S2JM02_9LACO|nr:arginine--tRNA ligase [Apilactobacillus micheneri]TPR38817.1 arginine--tRNA ligase [Apilactobacillus micheneri]TPR41964.1 arginine--tRNA ligase [Apilactobacillus micheneri]TPR42806.1 arginine--tRNA ligase [Apilactobacillus micheneri]TPR43045.1 arginine--tRNA ligase [Apilactobacillus micheneri]TPR43617.1 arginine--tRNA ligase [Apilactobacillus micheneri]
MENKELVAKALSNALDGTLNVEDIVNKIERPKDSKMGDLAFPTFILAKKFRKAPQQIASDIVEKIDQNDFDHVEAAGPYVNFFLDKAKYSENVIANVLSQSSNYGQNNDGNGGNVTIDMSSPNIAKPISMGHLRSTVIGNSVANILSKNGYKPIKDNHLGDWGTQFGKLITAYLMWGNEEDVKKDPINNLVKYYVKFHKVDKEKPELDDVARDWFRKLENGDEEATKLWKWFREVSIEAFEKIYDKLGVSFDTYNGEAFYNDKLQGVVDDLDKKGLLTKSQGATIVDLDKYNLNPALILKSDGASLYITRDIATAMYRDETYHPAMNLYVVGSEQTYYFKQLKAVLTEMGIPSAKDLHHIPFGLITVNGKKLSTRSGRIILLDEVLDDSIEIAKKQIAEKNPDLPNKDEVAKEVGVGAIVFGDLQNEKINNIDFNLEDQLRFEGETGPYVQYARARAESILRKSGKTEFSISDNKLNDAESWNIVKLLNDFPQMVKLACSEFEPSVIAKYSLRLAKAFNKYYAHTKILDDDDEKDARLALVKSVSIVLKESLRILGVKSPEEM